MRSPVIAAAIVGSMIAATVLSAQTVGPQDDGSVVLNSGWRVKPAGIEIPVDTFPMAAVVSRDKKYLLVLNGGLNPPSVSVIDLVAARELSRTPVPDGWLGLTLSKAGDRVYTGGGSRASIYEFSFSGGELKPSRVFPIVAEKARKPEDFIGDVQFSPDGRLLYAADLYRDSVVVVNPQSGLVIERIKTTRRPYRILFHPSGKSFYVSSWAEGSVSQYETATGNRMTSLRLAPHATDMIWREGEVEDHPELKARLFVAATDTNNIYSLGVTETGDLSRLETISLALTPRQPVGMTPAGLGLSADGGKLYVACSDMNAVAVVDISGPHSRVPGFAPTGVYPTAVLGLPDGRAGILNSHSVQLLEVADEAKLQAYTREVVTNSLYTDEKRDAPGLPANGPLRHVIYIVDGTLEYGAKNTPNRDKLGREFVQFENFHMNGGSIAEGGGWTTAAIATAYTRRLRQNSDAGRRPQSDYAWQEAANTPPAGYLWTNAAQAGIRMENFGFFVENLPKPGPDGSQISEVHDPVLRDITEDSFRGRDPGYPDTARAESFIASLREFEKSGAMPPLLLLQLGNEKPSPAMIADNDEALGLIVEAVSKSRFWSDTVIFIVPENATGAAGNAPAWVASPYVQHGATTRTLYSGTSVLRTVEMILGLHPLTVFDAASTPLFEVFSETANAAGFTAVKHP